MGLNKMATRRDTLYTPLIRILARINKSDLVKTHKELFSAYKHELVEYCEEQQHRLADALFRILRILKTRAIQLAQVSTACVALIALNVDIEYLREKKSRVLASPWINESLRTQLELLSETGLFQITLGETGGGVASQQMSVSDHEVELETWSGLVTNSDLVVEAPPSPTLSDEI